MSLQKSRCLLTIPLLGIVLSSCGQNDSPVAPVPESFWRFDGKTSFVQVGSAGLPPLGSGDFAIEAWFMPDTLGMRWDLLDWKDSTYAHPGSRHDLAIYYSGSSLCAYSAIDDYTKKLACLSLKGTRQWHHTALVRSSDSLTLMLDTARTSVAGYPGNVSPLGPLRIGANRTNGTGSNGSLEYPFKGIISDVRIYGQALAFDTFKSNLRGGSTPSGTTLLRRWKLSESEGPKALESVGGHDGTGVGTILHTTEP